MLVAESYKQEQLQSHCFMTNIMTAARIACEHPTFRQPEPAGLHSITMVITDSA
jgi:hypothetical protein